MRTSYNPWRDLRDRYPDVHVELHAIAPAHAFWATGLGVILVDRDIDVAERRCALAHEIAHMDIGDRPTEDCWVSGRQETAADKLAARRLIEAHELAAVLNWCIDAREIADELDVTVEVLRLRYRWLHASERGMCERAAAMREAIA